MHRTPEPFQTVPGFLTFLFKSPDVIPECSPNWVIRADLRLFVL